jgi:large subunit ribosomal protein L15
MDLTQVHKGVSKLKTKKRVGRGVGSGHGKTASRGHKGQWASAGSDKPIAVFEGGQMQLFRRIPKRGFSHGMWDKKFHVVNLGAIDTHFNDGDTVDPETVKKKGLANGPSDGIRILAKGEFSKKLTVRAHHVSKSAIEKIIANPYDTIIRLTLNNLSDTSIKTTLESYQKFENYKFEDLPNIA